jgi:hypothetical protein
VEDVMIGARVAWLAVWLAACGGSDGSAVDAAALAAPTIAVTERPVAGAPVRCTIVEPAGGARGPVTYEATWTVDAVAFAGATTTMFTGDSVPGGQSHTGQVFGCTVTARDGDAAVTSAAATATVEGRFAYLIDQAPMPAVLERIDLDALTITVVGSLGAPFDFGDLAWNARTGELYMVDGQRSLFKVDIGTGLATKVGEHGVVTMRSLAYAPGLDRMFGGVGTNRSPAIYALDVATAAATMLGGGMATDGLAYDTKRGRLVGLTSGGKGAFSAIDPATGEFTMLGTADELDNAGLTYDPYIDAFWAATADGQILRYDPEQFARTPAKMIANAKFSSLAIVLPR